MTTDLPSQHSTHQLLTQPQLDQLTVSSRVSPFKLLRENQTGGAHLFKADHNQKRLALNQTPTWGPQAVAAKGTKNGEGGHGPVFAPLAGAILRTRNVFDFV